MFQILPEFLKSLAPGSELPFTPPLTGITAQNTALYILLFANFCRQSATACRKPPWGIYIYTVYYTSVYIPKQNPLSKPERETFDECRTSLSPWRQREEEEVITAWWCSGGGWLQPPFHTTTLRNLFANVPGRRPRAVADCLFGFWC